MVNIKKNMVVSIAILMGTLINATPTLAIDTTKNTKGRPNKSRTYQAIRLCIDECSNELNIEYALGTSPFTYYIYDEEGCPVMFGSGEFDDDGLFCVSIDTLPSGDYTIEVIVNGSTHLCSFYKM